jgi:hypothetical protein
VELLPSRPLDVTECHRTTERPPLGKTTDCLGAGQTGVLGLSATGLHCRVARPHQVLPTCSRILVENGWRLHDVEES